MTKNCLFHTVSGGCASTFKPEHIIQKGLGGSLKSSELICSTCNKSFGDNLDHVLTKFFRDILGVLSPLLSGDLKDKKQHTKSLNSSTPLTIEPGGHVKVRGISKTTNENGVLTEIRGPLGASKSKFEEIAGRRADSFEDSFEKDDYLHVFSINELLIRAILLDLIEILRYATIHLGIPDIANHKFLEETKRWIRNGTNSSDFPPRRVPFAPISDMLDISFGACMFSHRLAVIYDQKQAKIIFSAQFVNTMPFVVILHDARIGNSSLSILYQKVLIDDAKLQDTLHTTRKPVIDYKDLEWARFIGTPDGQNFALCKFWQEYVRQYRKALYELDMRSDDTLCKEVEKYKIKHTTKTRPEAVTNIILDLMEDRYLHSPQLEEIKTATYDITQSKMNVNNWDDENIIKDIMSVYRICLKAIASNNSFGYPDKIRLIG